MQKYCDSTNANLINVIYDAAKDIHNDRLLDAESENNNDKAPHTLFNVGMICNAGSLSPVDMRRIANNINDMMSYGSFAERVSHYNPNQFTLNTIIDRGCYTDNNMNNLI